MDIPTGSKTRPSCSCVKYCAHKRIQTSFTALSSFISLHRLSIIHFTGSWTTSTWHSVAISVFFLFNHVMKPGMGDRVQNVSMWGNEVFNSVLDSWSNRNPRSIPERPNRWKPKNENNSIQWLFGSRLVINCESVVSSTLYGIVFFSIIVFL